MRQVLKISALAIVLSAGFISPVFAQMHDADNLRANEHIGINAGLHFTMPLGAKRKNKVEDKARFGLKLSASRQYGSQYSGTRNIHNMDMLDFGFHTDGEPSLMVYGQDLYRPLFGPLYADETGTEDGGEIEPNAKGGNMGTAVILVGGAALAGIVVLAAEGADRISDCLVFVNVPDKCK